MKVVIVPPAREARRRIALGVAGIVVDHLSSRFPDLDEGARTNYRQAIEAMVMKGLELEGPNLGIETALNVYGLEADPSTCEQANVLFQALRVFVERNGRYKDQWRTSGWRGAVYDIRKKAERLFRQYWDPANADQDEGEDDAMDLINFAGFFLRGRAEGNQWGTWL